MSDMGSTTAAADANKAKLDELIASKKGKRGASQLEAKQFTTAWVDYAKTVGINDETLGMLYDGFLFACGEPLYRYVAQTRNRSAYASMFAAKRTRANDRGIALKLAVNLLVLELPAPTADDSVRQIAHAIPSLSTNRDGKAFANFGGSISKVAAKPFAHKTADQSVSIDSADAAKILALLKGPAERYATGKNKRVEVDALTHLLAWLDAQARRGKADEAATAMGPGDSQSADSHQKDSHASSDARPTTETDCGSKSPSSAEAQASSEPSFRAERTSTAAGNLDMDDVLTFLASYKRGHDNLVKQNAELREAGRELSARTTQAEARLKGALREIASLREQASGLNERCMTLQKEAVDLREKNESLSGELAAAEEMYEVVGRRNARQADESTKRLASKLRVEYQDFLDAEGVQMDADLGENMREQLRNVFEILKSNGIEL